MKKLASRKDTRVIDLMIAFGPMGFGVYALLVEYLKERKALRSIRDIKRIAYELHADAETVRAVIEDFGLFTVDEEGIIAHKSLERKAQTTVQSEHSDFSELSEHSDPVTVAPKEEVSSPLSVAVVTSASKRRERRKRLRAYCV